jgi:SAM-dependent methyltransferase
MLGLEPALEACKGKTVLDLGCAEGAISLEFAKAGASRVVGIEREVQFSEVARQLCAGYPVEIINENLNPWIEAHPEPELFDIVLCLSIAHKVPDPAVCLSFACRSAKEFVAFRGPGKKEMFWDGWLTAKHAPEGQKERIRSHVPTVMQSHGFKEGATLDSGQGERIQYWHRQ